MASAEKEGIEGQLHHARCIQNALMDIKPEVGHLLKIGRKIIEGESFEKKMELKEKVDALEKDYHEAGCEVVQATRKLNEALSMSERLNSLTTSLDHWLTNQLLQKCSDLEVPMIKESVQEMVKQRESYEEIRRYVPGATIQGVPRQSGRLYAVFSVGNNDIYGFQWYILCSKHHTVLFG